MKLPINGADYQAFSSQVNQQKTVNWYPETDPTGKNNLVLYPTPGLTLLKTIGSGRLRAIINEDVNEYTFVVIGNTVYAQNAITGLTGTWASLGTATNLGSRYLLDTFLTGDHVYLAGGTALYAFSSSIFSSNSVFQIKQYSTGTTDGTTAFKVVDSTATFITDGVIAGMIVYNTTDSTKAIITSVDSETQLGMLSDIFVSGENYEVGQELPGVLATQQLFLEEIDGYFVSGDGYTNTLYLSSYQNGLEWSSLDTAQVGGDYNVLLGAKKVGGYLWIVGTEETQVWFNSGNADFPFERMPNKTIKYGGAGVGTMVVVKDSLIWVARDKTGYTILRSNGLSVERITDFAMENRLNSISYTKYGVTAKEMTWKGHDWFVITFESEDETWVYDLTTRVWFQWSTGASGGRHIGAAYSHYYQNNQEYHLIGGYADGSLYSMTDDVYKDNTTAIKRVRRSPVLNSEHKTLFQKSVEVVVDSGASVDATQTLDLKWSKDSGTTWSSTYNFDATATKTTQYITDSGESFIYEISTSDNYGPTIIDAYANIKPGRLENS